jgi:hypothetical protein
MTTYSEVIKEQMRAAEPFKVALPELGLCTGQTLVDAAKRLRSFSSTVPPSQQWQQFITAQSDVYRIILVAAHCDYSDDLANILSTRIMRAQGVIAGSKFYESKGRCAPGMREQRALANYFGSIASYLERLVVHIKTRALHPKREELREQQVIRPAQEAEDTLELQRQSFDPFDAFASLEGCRLGED